MSSRRGALALTLRLAAASLTSAATLASAPAAQADTTLRVVLINDLTSLDPVFSQAAVVRNHGFFVYDQLFALDSQGVPKPQMVDRYTASDDRLTWRFTLRDGLAFHDGQPVRAADAVASIKRWAQRDVVGKAMAAATASLDAVDEKSFELKLSRPFALVLEALARPTGSALFVMPERIARTPANTQITDATGSGPFILRKEEWRVGDRTVYVRNPAYRPRPEPADGLAGGKEPKVDRIEWLAMPDAAVAANALSNGEIDFIEQPPPDLIPQLERNRQLTVKPINPVGYMVWLRPNHAQPPFDNERARQALLFAVSQKDVLDGMGIRSAEQVPYCPAYFMCGTPLETAAGARGLKEQDLPRAREYLRQGGYDGSPVVFLNSTEQPLNNAATLVMAEALKQAGMNVDLPSMDWGTLGQRRNRKEGWNLFVTVANAFDAGDPLSNFYLASPCDGGLSGWPCDKELETLRHEWWSENDPAKRRALLDRVQARAYETVPYVNAGQFRTNAAWRASLTGIRPTTVPVFWGVEKH